MRRLILLSLCLLSAGLVSAHDAKRLEAVTFRRHARLPGLCVSYRTLAPKSFAHGSPVEMLTFVNEQSVRRTLVVEAFREGGCVTHPVVLEPAATVSVDFVLPTQLLEWSHDGQSMFYVREGAVRERIGIGVPTGLSEYEVRDKCLVNILVGQAVDAIATAADYDHADEAAKIPQKGRFLFSTQALGTEGWSADARAYSGYDLVLLTAAEWSALPAGARRALVGFAVQGGGLILCGQSELPAEAQGFPTSAAEPTQQEYAVGCGRIRLAPSLPADRRPPLSRAELKSLGEAACTRLRSQYGDKKKLRESLVEMGAQDIPTIPTSLFMGLLGLFAFGVVPAAICLCIHRKKRLAALFVLPTVSVALGLVIVLCILGVYGLTPYVTQQSTVMLNAADRRAAVFSKACIFAPTDVTDRLRFSRTAHIVTDRSERYTYHYSSTPRAFFGLTYGDVMSAYGDAWIKALKPSVYATTEMRDTNARLVVEEAPGGRLKVTNLLGAALTRLTVVDARGVLFSAADLPEGGSCDLSPAADQKREGWPKELAETRSVYLAEMAACPFLTDTLGGTKANRTEQTRVFGCYGKGVSE